MQLVQNIVCVYYHSYQPLWDSKSNTEELLAQNDRMGWQEIKRLQRFVSRASALIQIFPPSTNRSEGFIYYSCTHLERDMFGIQFHIERRFPPEETHMHLKPTGFVIKKVRAFSTCDC